MTVTHVTDGAQTGWMKIKIEGTTTSATTGLIGQVLNPEGVLVQITAGFLYIETPTAGAAVPLIGIAATGVSSNVINATLAMNQTAGTVWQMIGTDLASEAAFVTRKGNLWPATEYLTVTNSAVLSTLLVAYLYLQYVRLA
jgi:hypothetical protein